MWSSQLYPYPPLWWSSSHRGFISSFFLGPENLLKTGFAQKGLPSSAQVLLKWLLQAAFLKIFTVEEPQLTPGSALEGLCGAFLCTIRSGKRGPMLSVDVTLVPDDEKGIPTFFMGLIDISSCHFFFVLHTSCQGCGLLFTCEPWIKKDWWQHECTSARF